MKGRRDIGGRNKGSCLYWQRTDLNFTANIGAASSLKADTGLGEAETRQSMRKYIGRDRGYLKHSTKNYVLVLEPTAERGTV